MRIKVNRERCIGSGLCVLSAPEVFDQGVVDGQVVLKQQPDQPATEQVRMAAYLCPSGALSVVEDGSIEQTTGTEAERE